jgi:PASTA domain
MRWLKVSAAVVAATVLSALAAAPAISETTIGELAPGTSPSAYCVLGPFDGAPTGSAAAAYTVPAAGVITSWSTNAAAGSGQQLNFKVYRPLGEGKYLVVGHDGPRTLTPGVVNTFQTSIAVQAGDLIGNDDTNAEAVPSACEFETGNLGDTAWSAPGEAPDGATVQAEPEEEEGVRPNETATLVPPPTTSVPAPASGSITGGGSVAMSGATDHGACHVPKLIGKTLKAAKKKLKKADCELGKVTGHKSSKAVVREQKPKPGKVLGPGGKVNVKLG